jgi:hypothetical protein
MASYKTFKGTQLDLEIYQGKSTIDYPVEMLNDDGTAYDLSVYSSIVCKVYYRQHGEEIVTLTVTNVSNFLYLDTTKAQSAALQAREYFYECYGVLTSPANEQELLIYGVLKNN